MNNLHNSEPESIANQDTFIDTETSIMSTYDFSGTTLELSRWPNEARIHLGGNQLELQAQDSDGNGAIFTFSKDATRFIFAKLGLGTHEDTPTGNISSQQEFRGEVEKYAESLSSGELATLISDLALILGKKDEQ